MPESKLTEETTSDRRSQSGLDATPERSEHPGMSPSPVDNGHQPESPDSGNGTMTPTLLGRLFGVPLLIVSVIVGCTVVVVLLFGSITTERERSLVSLVDILETGSSEKTVGVLLPNEKELWQAAKELALRLRAKDSELTAEELAMVTERLVALLQHDTQTDVDLSDMQRKKVHFVMRSLAMTESTEAVDPLIHTLSNNAPETRREALASLSLMRNVPAAKRALPAMIAALQDSNSVVRTVACVALSSLAAPGETKVIDSLKRAYFDNDREVKWNASLSLARLGDPSGKLLLLDMLNRSYWENEVPIRKETRQGVTEYPMPAPQVANYLVTAVEAGAHLDDKEIWQQIRVLADDALPQVQNAARRAMDRHRGRTTVQSEG